MKILGCGDIFITRRLPQGEYKGFTQLRKIIEQHDVRFGNLEVTVCGNEKVYPSNSPGGGWAITTPRSLSDIKRFGFNVLNIANNHALDFCRKGLEATIKSLEYEDLQYIGAGIDLSDASRPKYIECSDRSRVAIIGITSSFNATDAAGYMGRSFTGRPGVNPLRRQEQFELTADLYDNLHRVINTIRIKETYRFPDVNSSDEDKITFRGTTFIKGECNRRITKINNSDLQRTLVSIEEAKTQADCTIVSFHSHQFAGEYENPHEFIVDFCHQCIDAGADIVFGHGVHTIRGLEMYNGKPIFYGLGDFVFQNDMMETQPIDLYIQQNMESSYHDCVGLAMIARSSNETRGLNADPRTWEGILASLDFDSGTIKRITLYPINLGFEKGRTYRGWPVIDETGNVIKRFVDISKKYYGTSISLDGCLGFIEL